MYNRAQKTTAVAPAAAIGKGNPIRRVTTVLTSCKASLSLITNVVPLTWCGDSGSLYEQQ